MTTTKIMLMRHGEKPSPDGDVLGVDEAGNPSGDELSVIGWQRAGAIARLFAPLSGEVIRIGLATPNALFTPAVAGAVRSKRAKHTVLPLSKLLSVTIRADIAKGQEARLAQEVLNIDGVVLVCWEHKAIPSIANAIVGDDTTTPQTWPDDRFDLVWCLDRSGDGWVFSQVPQLVLPGDSDQVI